MKRTKREMTDTANGVPAKEQWCLPLDVMQRIALFLEDSRTFFNYLEAFRSHLHRLGCLRHFVDLAASTPVCDLWPQLKLHHLDATKLAPFKPILSCFTAIHVRKTYDLDLLGEIVEHDSERHVLHLLDMPNQIDLKMPIEEWYKALLPLPIISLTWTTNGAIHSPSAIWTFMDTIPRMDHLKWLNLDHARLLSLDPLMQFIGGSRLTRVSLKHMRIMRHNAWNFDLNGMAPVMTHLFVAHLHNWLQHAPITHWSMAGWDSDCDTSCLNQLVATTTTLEHVDMHQSFRLLFSFHQSLTELDPLPMAYLDLSSCSLDACDILGLFLALCYSNVKHLNIGNNHFRDDGCVHIAEYLSTTQLVHLDMSSAGITDVGAIALANAINDLPTLSSLVLDDNKIHMAAAIALVEMMKPETESSDRSMHLSLVNNAMEEAHVDRLARKIGRLPPSLTVNL
ncbi:hypothetical protein AeMF1_000555 [Aphanomyces euteiches]|nr:hypothetical protein AeMF1_000555 [Aphanomyces euteiches]KAH9190507.1 hypothetical protein AeNC1_007514 [Aphanomyces euteiches]